MGFKIGTACRVLYYMLKRSALVGSELQQAAGKSLPVGHILFMAHFSLTSKLWMAFPF